MGNIKDKLSERSPEDGERCPKFKKGIEHLEAEAFSNWKEFIQAAVTKVCMEDNKELIKRHNETIPFAGAFIPFTKLLYDEISTYLKAKPFLISDTALENVLSGLTKDYLEACGLALYCTIQDEIPSRTAREYQAWVEDFYKNRWLSFTAEYPVLGILLKQRYDQYFHHCCEVFDRLEKDCFLIQKTFGIPITSISGIELRLSDRHNHGRSVCKIEINGTLEIIYKPKSLKNEVWMQNLLHTHSGFKDSRIGKYKALDMGEYGWSEFIQTDKKVDHCTSDIIESYSSLLAIFYLINASDMHTENVMICENKFYPIDLETIFNPSISKLGHKFNWREYSIFYTGMLFDDLDVHLSKPDVNTHYYSNKNMQPMYNVVLDKKFGVALHIEPAASKQTEKDDIYIPSKLNAQEWLSFAEKTEKKILDYKAYLASDEVFINKSLSCRYVPRNTAFYARIQQVLYHPNKLRDFKDWEAYIGQLVETVDPENTSNSKDYINLINSEIAQLKRGDIPYFTFTSTSKNLTADNKVITDNFFEDTGQDTILKKLKDLNNSDADEIKKILIAKYITWNQKPEDHTIFYFKKNNQNEFVDLNSNLIDSVKGICDSILSSANINKDQPARWLSHEGDVTGLRAFHAAGSLSYYNGYWGIIAFLAAAKRQLSDKDGLKINKFLDREMQIWFSDKRPTMFFSNTGLSGLAGSLKSLLIIDAVQNNSVPVILQEIYGRTNDVYKGLEKKFDEKEFTDIDYMAGKLGLFSVLHHAPHGFIDKLKLTTYLNIYHNDIMNHWESYIRRRDKALVGFAHGISSLTNHLGNFLFLNKDADNKLENELLQKVWKYDRSCKVAESDQWCDNRYLDVRPVNRSWCHGLAGIGLSRLPLLKLDDYKDNAYKDIDFIFDLLSKQEKTTGSHILCCGDCGEIDFLIETSKIDKFYTISCKLLNTRLPILLQEIGDGSLFCGSAGKTQTLMAPDLFQGAAGIAYTLLRVNDKALPTLY